MPPKAITPIKPQKNLFSFFQKTPSTPSGATASGSAAEGGTGAGGISPSPLSQNHNVDTHGDAKVGGGYLLDYLYFFSVHFSSTCLSLVGSRRLQIKKESIL